jgi:hypothetical protein
VNVVINVRFEVLTVVTILYNLTPYSLVDVTEVLEERTASVFRVEE